MLTASVAQVLHIGRMFFGGALSRAQFEEFNNLAVAGQLTEDVAQSIIEGRFEFKNRLSAAHLAKARIVWERFGKKLFGVTFEKYVNGTDGLAAIPMFPSWPRTYLTAFDRDVLVDGRVIERIGLTETCRIAGLISERDDPFEAYEPMRAKTGVRWMRAQPGRKNRNRKPVDCRKAFEKYEVGMAADEGVFTYVDDPTVIDGHWMDLPGSVHREGHGRVACLGISCGEPELDWRWDDNDASPRCGSASRGE